jgi:hypothetical protein
MFDMAIRGKELRHDGKMITPFHAKEHFRGVCSTKREEGGISGPLPCLWSSGDGEGELRMRILEYHIQH